MRASIAVAVAVLAGCFNPTFNNPACGPQGECPAGHTCVQGVCRTQADPIDAPPSDGVDPIDGAPSDGVDPIDGPPGDGPPGDGTPGCQMRACAGVVYQCGNCIDEDADGLVDAFDPECLGACDNTEGPILQMGVPNETATCPLDLYWDNNTGQGNDDCRWDLRCYQDAGFVGCPFSKGMVGSNQCPSSPSSFCVNTSSALTPNGCDCFGCCLTPDGTRSVFLGARNAAGVGTCSFATMNDPNQCPACTPNMGCFNQCMGCDVCVGRPLPAVCGGVQTCPTGRNRCGQVGQAECPVGEYCVTGCCQPTLP
jgi:hypothetical protein